ncbi:MAG TPA: endonuclease/exonuclease/phosphatase family protein [Chitinophagales bacterium]|nr:endonuclease/exonuclease/phosphatase family protein [Chitinophagales bacterium]
MKRFFRYLFYSVFIFGCALFIATFLGNYIWFFDLISHFRMQALCVFIITFFIFIFLKDKKFIIINTAIVFYVLISIIPFYFHHKKSIKSKNNLKLFYTNVLTSNQNFGALIELIKQENPDIIDLIEINEDWESHIHCDLDEYKYKVSFPRDDNFGVLILSKKEILRSEIKYFCSYEIPTIYACIKSGNDSINFILTHTIPPTSSYDFIQRNLQLENINKFVKQQSNSIIVGDFNCSSFSQNYNRILKKSNLKDSRIGFGLQPSWPTWAPIFYVTLDHILVSKNINIIDRKTLSGFGSDHLPIVMEFSL